ncbi:MAG: universal stress protein [Bacteroidales bacterium]|nr:universal stress protein [Bacteroidales bacterium]
MKKFNRVLIALDYDPTATEVAEKGFLLARSMDAELILLHVVSDMVLYSSADYSPIMGFTGFNDMSQIQMERTDELKNVSRKYLEKTRQHLGDENIKIVVEEGDFADTIISVAGKMGVDMIVMGSHSRKWLEEILVGSVTETVLRRTEVPLFIVPTKQKK